MYFSPWACLHLSLFINGNLTKIAAMLIQHYNERTKRKVHLPVGEVTWPSVIFGKQQKNKALIGHADRIWWSLMSMIYINSNSAGKKISFCILK